MAAGIVLPVPDGTGRPGSSVALSPPGAAGGPELFTIALCPAAGCPGLLLSRLQTGGPASPSSPVDHLGPRPWSRVHRAGGHSDIKAAGAAAGAGGQGTGLEAAAIQRGGGGGGEAGGGEEGGGESGTGHVGFASGCCQSRLGAR